MFLGLLIYLFITLIILDGISVTSQICDSNYAQCINPKGYFIGYPFWWKDGEANGSYCGYPGLSISCREERQVINISNHLYYVQSVDYLRQTLRMVDVDIEGSDCPQPRHNLSLKATAFSSDRKTQIYYNCTGDPPQDVMEYYYEHLPCLDHVGRNVILRSFLFIERGYEIPKKRGFDCEETVELPYLNHFSKSNYIQMLKFGFQLNWYTPSNSSLCEDSGGRSFFNQSTSAYNCYCYRDYEHYPSIHESVCPHKDGQQLIAWSL